MIDKNYMNSNLFFEEEKKLTWILCHSVFESNTQCMKIYWFENTHLVSI